ncbi:MAG: DUF3617 family protein [Lysobacterales bacterium]
MRFQIILAGLATVLISGTGNAAGVSVQPGLWEMTSTMTMTMLAQPQVNTVQQCIKEDEISPESFNMEKDSPCKISDIDIDGHTARWSITCPTEGGPVMDGTWEFTSNGDSISGNGSMSTEYSGQKFGFDMTWVGNRVGPCK